MKLLVFFVLLSAVFASSIEDLLQEILLADDDVKCGDGNCDAGEIDSFCLADCKDEIKDLVCAAANKHNACGATCPILQQLEPKLYGLGICGQVMTEEQKYSEVCGAACPPPECGDGTCDAGEVDSFCLKDCKDEIKDLVCATAFEKGVCDKKCPVLQKIAPNLYGMGVCGGVMKDSDKYSDVCGDDCPKPRCGDGRCDDGEVARFCMEDCKDELRAQVCAVAKENHACGKKCPVLQNIAPRLYSMGVCGGVMEWTDKYSEVCGDACPDKPMCKDGDGAPWWCRVRHRRWCPWWARRGECDKNPAYMLRCCAGSCNQCPDEDFESELASLLHGDFEEEVAHPPMTNFDF